MANLIFIGAAIKSRKMFGFSLTSGFGLSKRFNNAQKNFGTRMNLFSVMYLVLHTEFYSTLHNILLAFTHICTYCIKKWYSLSSYYY